MSRVEHLAEGVTLYLGDCRDYLPDLNFTLGVTDPPYGVREDAWDDMSERDFAALSMSWLPHFMKARECFVFGYLDSAVHRLCKMLWPRTRELVWAKPVGSQLSGAHEKGRWFSFEAIFHSYTLEEKIGEVARQVTAARKAAGFTRSGVDVLVRGKATGLCYRWEEGACLPTFEQVRQLREFLPLGEDFDKALTSELKAKAVPAERFDVLTHRTVTAGRHPCEKPLALMEDLILSAKKLDDVVCDPFLGSGSTGVAAVRLGVDFVGIERDQSYFDMACRRISDALSRPDMFVAPRPPEPVQEALI